MMVTGHLFLGLALFPSGQNIITTDSFLMRIRIIGIIKRDWMRVGSNFIYLDYADSDTEQTLLLIAPDPS